MRFLLTLLLAVFLASPAQAQSAQARGQVVLAWTNWLAKHRVSTSQLAVAWQGQVVENRGYNIETGAPMNMASLSKAVTGLCVMQLIADEQLTLETTIGDVLRAAGELTLAETVASERTIQQLLLHTTGFKPDITQGRVQDWYRAGPGQLRAIALEALEERNQVGEVGRYFYANTNYAVLGWLVELKTGTFFLEACKEILAGRKGIDGFGTEAKFEAISAFGGLQASAADYLALLTQAYGKDSAAQEKPLDMPLHTLDRNLYYGPGIVMRQRRGEGANFWHFGTLCLPDRDDDVGSYVGVYGSGWSVTVLFDKCLNDKALVELDNVLVRALTR